MERITIEQQREENLRKIKNKQKYFALAEPHVDIQKIKRLREEFCLTQSDMANFLELKNIADYTRREQGVLQFKLIEIYKIAKAFEHSVDWFISERDIGD